MNTVEVYDLFVKLLEEEKIYLDPDLTFESFCAGVQQDPNRLDDHILSEVGMTGEEVIAMYRKGSDAAEEGGDEV